MKIVAVLVGFVLGLTPIAAHSQEVPLSTKWKTIEAVEDGFTIEVPEVFKYERNTSKGRFEEGRGEYLSDGLYLYAFVDPINIGRQSEVVLNFIIANRRAGFVEHIGGKTITRYEFVGFDGYFHTIIFRKSDASIIAFHAVSQKASDPSAARFIKSIRFGPAPSEPVKTEGKVEHSNPNSELEPDTDPTSPKPGPGAGIGSGSGSGRGSGSGISSGSGSGPGTSSPGSQVAVRKPEILPLRILYKQKARYTDFARFYNISGNILLRVTFMDDNTIGSITRIRTLPFGLTEQAIIAAKGMKFEAEKANGKPRNTSRPVSFKFSIY